MLGLLLTASIGATLRKNIGSMALNKAAASTVEVYTLAELSLHKYIGLGEVSSNYCSTEVDPIERISVDDLKNDFKVQVQKQGGNAIIFYVCGRLVILAVNNILNAMAKVHY